MALKMADWRRLRQAQGGIEEERQAARPRHVEHHRARGGGRASRAPKSASTAAARCRCSPARINQGQGHETTFKQMVCRQARRRIPNDIEYIQGDTDKVFFGEGTGGSRSATMSRLGVPHGRPRRSIAKAKAIAAHNAEGRRRGRQVRGRASSPAPRPTRRMTIKDVAQDAFNPAKLPKDMEAGLVRHRGLQGRRRELPERRATSARSRSTPRPARPRW